MSPPRGALGRLGRGLAAACVVGCLFGCVLGCTGKPPEILRVFWQVNLVEDRERGAVYQSLSLFLRPRDPDGFEDIEEVYLVNDAEELFWRLDAGSWRQSGSGDETWIGSNAIRLPDGSALPSGEYRVLLRDVGGDSAEQSLQIQAPPVEQARLHLPDVSVRDGSVLISGRAASYQLWLYDSAGAFVGSRPALPGATPTASLLADFPVLRGGFSMKVYAYVPGLRIGVISGPYYLSP